MSNSDYTTPLALTSELENEKIVTSYNFDFKSRNLILDLNHKYSKKKIISPVESKWNKTIKNLEEQLRKKGIKQQHITLLTDTVENNWEIFVDSASKDISGGGSSNKKKEKHEYLAYKYSNRKKGDIHEAVILDGKPVFLKCSNGLMSSVEKIHEEIRIIKPPHIEHYPYDPYEFESMNEVLSYVERAKNETIDSLYLQAKQIATDYNDQKKHKVGLLVIEIIWSWFQDKFPTTHYNIVLGGNGSGKSSYGITFAASGYRVVNLTSPNAANINRILGSVEVGQCTIISDETGAIEKNDEMMSLLKNGYDSKGKTSKINDYTRDPEFFYAYCFKMIIAERMPNLKEAKGVRDRSFEQTCYKGRPKFDIKETLEPQGNPARQERLDGLNDFKKIMLIYRLLHFKDAIPDIDVGVEGREKELSKPVIQLFYGTKAQKEVEDTLQNFLNLRGEKKEITLEPILHPIVTNLVKDNGTEISVKQVWTSIKESIEGYSDDKRPNEYQTLEYGTIYNNTISNILEHTFGGRPRHKKDGNVFIFDPEELTRVGRSYTSSGKIETILSTKIGEGYEGSEGSTGEHTSSNEFHDTDSRGKRDDQSSNNNEKEGGAGTQEPSQPSQPSPPLASNQCYYCNELIAEPEFVPHLDQCAKEQTSQDDSLREVLEKRGEERDGGEDDK